MYAAFTVTVFGQSATVEMTVTLPYGWRLLGGGLRGPQGAR